MSRHLCAWGTVSQLLAHSDSVLFQRTAAQAAACAPDYRLPVALGNYRPFQRLKVNKSRTGPLQMTIKAAPLTDGNPKVHPDPMSNTEKNPDDWVSGDDAMTGAQASYLKTLSEQAPKPEEFDSSLTKADASKRIDALKARLAKE